MRSPLLTFAFLLTLGAGVAWGWLLRDEEGAPAPPSAAPPSAEAVAPAALDSVQAALRRTRARLERLAPPAQAEEDALRYPDTRPYSVHRERAESLGIPRVTASRQIDSLAADGRLIPLADNDYYVVRALEHSAPFATPDLARLLDEIGRRFQTGLRERGLPPYRFVVSSLLRTPTLQDELRAGNRNAAVNASSHEYGVSADLVIWRYAHAPDSTASLALPPGTAGAEAYRALQDEALAAYGYRYWDHLFGLMTRILTDLQEAGDAVVLLEDAQPVFHITVGRRFR